MSIESYDHKNWRAVDIESCPAHLLDDPSAGNPDYDGLRKWLFDQYFVQTVSEDNLPASDSEGFLRWLSWQETHGDLSRLLTIKSPRLTMRMFVQSASKSIGISQRHCFECSRSLTLNEMYPVKVIPLRIDPISWQASNSDLRVEFRERVLARLGAIASDFDKVDAFCVSLTFRLNASSRDRDCDNMAKGLLDVLAKAMNVNDNKFVHVDIMKLTFPDCEDGVTIRVGPSGLLRNSDVLVPLTKVSWAGWERMELTNR